jgi:hypothetical protein
VGTTCGLLPHRKKFHGPCMRPHKAIDQFSLQFLCNFLCNFLFNFLWNLKGTLHCVEYLLSRKLLVAKFVQQFISALHRVDGTAAQSRKLLGDELQISETNAQFAFTFWQRLHQLVLVLHRLDPSATYGCSAIARQVTDGENRIVYPHLNLTVIQVSTAAFPVIRNRFYS